MANNDSLKHYGILGMKWGVRRTKAQLARARGKSGTRKVTKEQYEALKDKAIKSGNPDVVRAWSPKLSNKELKDAIDRVDYMKKLDTIDGKAKKSGLDRVEEVTKTIGRVTRIGEDLAGAYGFIAKINNTFNDRQLPVIDGTYFGTKRDKADKQRANDEAKEAREVKKAAEDSAKEAREAKRASDTQEISERAAKGDYDSIIRDWGKYDPQAIKDVKDALDKKTEFENWAKRRSTPDEEKK